MTAPSTTAISIADGLVDAWMKASSLLYPELRSE